MKWRHRLVSARIRILSLAVVAIVIPSLFLAGFGFQVHSEYRARTEEVVLRAYRTEAEGRISRILGRVQDMERKLLSRLPERPIPELLAQLPHLSQDFPLARSFFVIGSSQEILFPVDRQELLPEPIEPRAEPGARGAESLLDSGYQLESQGQLAAAADKYRRCADGPFSASLRIEALTSLGGCLFRLGRHGDALAAYRRLSEEFETRDVPVPYGLLAQYQIGRILLASGQVEQAAQAFLDLYGSLVARPASRKTDTWEFFREEAVASLQGLLDAGGAASAVRQPFEQLRRADAERAQQRLFRLELTRWLGQRVEWDARSKSPAIRTFLHFHEWVEGKPFAVAYTLVPRERGEKPAILGFQIDLDYVRQHVLSAELAETQSGRGTLFAILDDRDHVVFPASSEPPDRPDASHPSDGGAPDEAGPYTLLHPFPEIFGFWKLGLLDPGNEALRRLSQKQYVLITALLAFTVALMMAGVYLTLRDMNRELEVSRLQSDFVSNVSHELKTPLALIRMFSETLLLGRVKSKEKEREYVEVITRESERLTQLIDNVLDFARIESGRKQYHFERGDVGEVVRTTVEDYREELEVQGFRLTLEVEEGLPPAMVDRAAVTQALLNLLNNAQKYSRENKEITVSVRARDHEIRVELADRGIGIPEADQEKIFEKFYRVEDDFVRSVSGSGLGLAIAWHTMEAHGGRIEVRSRPGEGSTFSLVLPYVEKAPDALAAESPASGGDAAAPPSTHGPGPAARGGADVPAGPLGGDAHA